MNKKVRPSHFRVLALPAFHRRDQNPFTALLYDQIGRFDVEVDDWSFWRAVWKTCDIWHFHHPDTVVFPRRRWQSFAEATAMRFLLGLAKLRGIKVLWTVHDLGSHDGLHPSIERWFWRYFPPRVDAFVSLTKTGQALAQQRWPELSDKPSFIVPHGHFRDVYPNTVNKFDARSRLGLDPDSPVLLHYGLIRPYKSVPNLIKAFQRIPGQSEAVLLIAGKVWDSDLENAIIEQSECLSNVRLKLEWIPFEETQLYFNACDLVVLPYRQILNSGSALLALGFDRPVLVPDLGVMPEHRDRFGAEWIRLFEGDIAPETLSDAIGWALQPRAIGVDWDGLDWASLAQTHRDIYDAILLNSSDIRGQSRSIKG